MWGKCLFGAVAALALISNQQAATPPPTFVQSDYIEKISCLAFDDEGILTPVSGTGFKLKDGRWITATHVSSNIDCRIDGLRIAISHVEEVGDVTIFTVPDDTRKGGYEVDCGGYLDRKWYHALGHANGLPVIRSIPLMYSRALDSAGGGMSVLIYNRVIPGQSGGPIVGGDGRVVGVVNAYNIFFPISFSRELRGTAICQS